MIFRSRDKIGPRALGQDDRLIRHGDEERIAVRLRIDRDAGDPYPMRRFEDAAGDFAAIGNEDFFEHGRRRLRSEGKAVSTQAKTPRP